ncbi:hypothetical protein BLNAU_9577 [Blattamonas nauphoetae]|uniref:Uncharacterized protein n=1 Tax=Blattamonas nauphoetae TaxID=2049346 RepID=A0ABQ9XVM0_9EUKA|nr:hypothetical protein BLNAU_9577 [Blattamonas nauphoetae]
MPGHASTASNNSGTAPLEQENLKTLTSLIASKCEAGEEIEWKDLMEWFVCTVIGLESAVSESNGSFLFDWDDVVVDGLGTTRITNLHSPQFIKFNKLVDPELVEVRKRFDPDFFEEAKHISLWKEFLQKVAGGEEVANDTSFLKFVFFRPTLLSLQAKFQQLASSLDGSVNSSTSSAHFKQESLELLTILHSLLSSPLPPSLPFSLTDHSPTDNIGSLLTLVHQNEPVNPEEIFISSLFDEADDEKLSRSLKRCLSVCELVGVEKSSFISSSLRLSFTSFRVCGIDSTLPSAMVNVKNS